jgi:hypothetical protein
MHSILVARRRTVHCMRSRAALLLALASTVGCRGSPEERERRREQASQRIASRGENVCLAFLEAVRGRNWRRAHDSMHASYRASRSVAQLRDDLSRHPLLLGHTGAFVFESAEARAHGLLHVGGERINFECHHMQEGGGDRILSLTVAGVPLIGLGLAPVAVDAGGSEPEPAHEGATVPPDRSPR